MLSPPIGPPYASIGHLPRCPPRCGVDLGLSTAGACRRAWPRRAPADAIKPRKATRDPRGAACGSQPQVPSSPKVWPGMAWLRPDGFSSHGVAAVRLACRLPRTPTGGRNLPESIWVFRADQGRGHRRSRDEPSLPQDKASPGVPTYPASSRLAVRSIENSRPINLASQIADRSKFVLTSGGNRPSWDEDLRRDLTHRAR